MSHKIEKVLLITASTLWLLSGLAIIFALAILVVLRRK